MIRSFIVSASLLSAGLAFANPTPTQLGKIKAHFDQDAQAKVNAANGAYKNHEFHVHTTMKNGVAHVRGAIFSKRLSWPFPRQDGTFEGPREDLVRTYTVNLIGQTDIHVTSTSAWMMGDEHVK
jgi:hypothetical protein